LNALDEDIKAKNLYISSQELTKQIYKNQILKVDYNALILSGSVTNIKTEFSNYANIEILNKSSSWRIENGDNYKNSFYFLIKDLNVKLPDIKVIVESNSVDSLKQIDSEKLDGNSYKAINLDSKSAKFSKVLAEELILKSYKIDRYDNLTNIVVIELGGVVANLDKFSLKFAQKEGIESKKIGFPNSEIIYFAVIPNNLEAFEFEYFSLKNSSFEKISIPNIPQTELVSTQSDIKPKDSGIVVYKIVIISIITVLFLLFYLYQKKIIYLILALATIFSISFISIKHSTVTIKSGSEIYLLPTPNSTILEITAENIDVEELIIKDSYTKIILKDERIGWVKNENIIKN